MGRTPIHSFFVGMQVEGGLRLPERMRRAPVLWLSGGKRIELGPPAREGIGRRPSHLFFRGHADKALRAKRRWGLPDLCPSPLAPPCSKRRDTSPKGRGEEKSKNGWLGESPSHPFFAGKRNARGLPFREGMGRRPILSLSQGMRIKDARLRREEIPSLAHGGEHPDVAELRAQRHQCVRGQAFVTPPLESGLAACYTDTERFTC